MNTAESARQSARQETDDEAGGLGLETSLPPAGESDSLWAAHRGGLIANLGIASLVVVMLSGPVLCCCTPMVFPLWIAGAVLGGVAAFWGRSDLQAMAAAQMNPAGRAQTELGSQLGLAGAILGTLVAVVGIVLTTTGVLNKLASSWR